MPDQTPATRTPKVYVIQGRGQRDYADCQAALDRVPARMESLPFIGDATEVIERTRDADALIVSSSPVTRRVMESLEGLKVVVRTGVGYDVIDVPAATELGVVVVNVPDVWIREVANHALALLLAWNRKIVVLDREVRAGVWSSRVPARSPARSTARRSASWAWATSAAPSRAASQPWRRASSRAIPYVDDARFAALGVERVDLATLAARADYVSVHTLLNAETRGLINEAFFRRMKPTACLINTSRGPVVDEAALARALEQRWLAGAALDVFEEEPLGADSPLRRARQRDPHPARRLLLVSRGGPGAARCGEEVARVLTKERPLHVVEPRGLRPRPSAARALSGRRAMHLGIFSYNVEYGARPDELARAAEERGFESLLVPRAHPHPGQPQARPFPGGERAAARSTATRHDPFVALMAAAGGDHAAQARHRHLPGDRARPDRHRQGGGDARPAVGRARPLRHRRRLERRGDGEPRHALRRRAGGCCASACWR